MQVTDRIFFYNKMVEFLARQDEDIRTTFRMPISIDFDNNIEEGST